MKVIVNGKEKILQDKAVLKDALEGEHYVKGTLVSIHKSTERLVKESEDFEIVTDKGTMVIHLDNSKEAEVWRSMIPKMSDLSLRWSTERINAFGSFPTDIKPDKSENLHVVLVFELVAFVLQAFDILETAGVHKIALEVEHLVGVVEPPGIDVVVGIIGSHVIELERKHDCAIQIEGSMVF